MAARTLARRTTGIVAAISVALLALVACSVSVTFGDETAAVSTDVNDFVFESMDADYTLGRADDGTSTMTVVETFVAIFPEYDQNRGMRRILPDSYLGAPLHPQLVSITDADGNPRPAEVESEDGAYAITSRADDYVHGAQTYVFTYTLENVARFFDNTGVDELNWNVNGVDWAQPFGSVSVTLHVPAELAPAVTGAQACYVGEAGSTDRCPIASTTDADGGVTVTASASDLQPYETVTIAVAFDAGTFTPFDSSYTASPYGWLQLLAFLGAVGSLVWAIVFRVRMLRDEPGRPTIIPEYTPPPRIDALESAVLLGKTTKAIPAEVLEQAVVGSIRIEEAGRKLFGGLKLKAVLVDPARADGDGLLLLQGLFPHMTPGEEYEFGSNDTRLSSAARRIIKAAERELDARGLRRPVPGGARFWPMAGAIVFGILTIVFGFFALGAFVDATIVVLLMIPAFVMIFVVAVLVSRKPLTAAGAETRDHLAGLQMFIEWAEADRIRMLQSPQGAERIAVDDSGVRVDPANPRQMLRIYETLLPYAVVFGQEEEWSEHLAVLYDQTGVPGWYVGTAGFNAAAFSSGISTLSTTTTASTSGGSSGGGSAGGGGGGGGGGGV